MPYITEKDRYEQLPNGMTRESLGIVVGNSCRNGGDLQFIIAKSILTYLKRVGFRYKNMESIMGALSGSLREFQRKVVDPYEAKKEVENTSIYRNMF